MSKKKKSNGFALDYLGGTNTKKWRHRGYSTYSTKIPVKNQIWLAKYPYLEKGNWYKVRPVVIIDVIPEDDSCTVAKVTSTEKEGYKKIRASNKFDKMSYLSGEFTILKNYMLIRKIGFYRGNDL